MLLLIQIKLTYLVYSVMMDIIYKIIFVFKVVYQTVLNIAILQLVFNV